MSLDCKSFETVSRLVLFIQLYALQVQFSRSLWRTESKECDLLHHVLPCVCITCSLHSCNRNLISCNVKKHLSLPSANLKWHVTFNLDYFNIRLDSFCMLQKHCHMLVLCSTVVFIFVCSDQISQRKWLASSLKTSRFMSLIYQKKCNQAPAVFFSHI